QADKVLKTILNFLSTNGYHFIPKANSDSSAAENIGLLFSHVLSGFIENYPVDGTINQKSQALLNEFLDKANQYFEKLIPGFSDAKLSHDKLELICHEIAMNNDRYKEMSRITEEYPGEIYTAQTVALTQNFSNFLGIDDDNLKPIPLISAAVGVFLTYAKNSLVRAFTTPHAFTQALASGETAEEAMQAVSEIRSQHDLKTDGEFIFFSDGDEPEVEEGTLLSHSSAHPLVTSAQPKIAEALRSTVVHNGVEEHKEERADLHQPDSTASNERTISRVPVLGASSSYSETHEVVFNYSSNSSASPTPRNDLQQRESVPAPAPAARPLLPVRPQADAAARLLPPPPLAVEERNNNEGAQPERDAAAQEQQDPRNAHANNFSNNMREFFTNFPTHFRNGAIAIWKIITGIFK
ncbi:MAG: hypothetical protein V4629_12920, partial [Pseudomonadota bacterium]